MLKVSQCTGSITLRRLLRVLLSVSRLLRHLALAWRVHVGPLLLRELSANALEAPLLRPHPRMLHARAARLFSVSSKFLFSNVRDWGSVHARRRARRAVTTAAPGFACRASSVRCIRSSRRWASWRSAAYSASFSSAPATRSAGAERLARSSHSSHFPHFWRSLLFLKALQTRHHMNREREHIYFLQCNQLKKSTGFLLLYKYYMPTTETFLYMYILTKMNFTCHFSYADKLTHISLLIIVKLLLLFLSIHILDLIVMYE